MTCRLKSIITASIAILFIVGPVHAYRHELEKGLHFPNADVVMKIAMATPPSLAGFRGIYDFEEEVEARSGGSIDVKIFHSGSMGGNAEVLNKCQTGVLQGAFNGAPVTANLAKPVHNILNIPFLFSTYEDAKRFINSDLVKPVNDSLEHAGLKILGICSFGKIDFLTRKPINNINDLKGMKMRCNPGKWGVIPAKALGIEASPIPFPEVYTQLQQGILDGIINSPDVITLGKWEEICKHYTKVGFYHGFLLFVVNQRWLDKLPDDQRKIIIEAGQRMTRDEMERAEYRYLQLLNKFRKNEVKINELSSTDLEKMRGMWQEYKDDFVDQIGEEYYRNVEKFIQNP
jgi:TRAP-type C4-dicarboxylate transport system substrate-binding protein